MIIRTKGITRAAPGDALSLGRVGPFHLGPVASTDGDRLRVRVSGWASEDAHVHGPAGAGTGRLLRRRPASHLVPLLLCASPTVVPADVASVNVEPSTFDAPRWRERCS